MNIKEILAVFGIKSSLIAGSVIITYVMVPLPTFEGSPTGLKLTYSVLSTPHIKAMSEWVVNLDDLTNRKDNNGESLNTAEFNYYTHGNNKPKKYEYDDRDEYMDAMEDFREEMKDLKDRVKRLKQDRGDLIEQRRQMIAQSPAKKFSAL